MENPQVTPPVLPQKPVTQKKSNRFFWPFVLVAIGIVLLIQNLQIGLHLNWWAVFIFIPVAASLSTAWSQMHRFGKFDATVAGSLGSALVVGTVAVLLLLGSDWSRWWPLMIITPGVSLLLTGIAGSITVNNINLKALWFWNIWLGLAAILLGAGFLASTAPVSVLEPFTAGYRWWAVPILIAGAGALVSALYFFMKKTEESRWTGWALVVAGICIIAVGALALWMLSWEILLPVILIAVGVVVMTGVLSRK